jgi:phosphomethylpyrimidine synthase
MREIRLADSTSRLGPIAHDAVTVYDTSGPYTDPGADIDLGAGLPPLRERWIAERGDVEEQPADAFGERSEPAACSRLVFARLRPPRRAKAGANLTQQMHYVRRGLITPELVRSEVTRGRTITPPKPLTPHATQPASTHERR